MSCHALPCHAMPLPVPCHTIPYAMPCRAMLCSAVPCGMPSEAVREYACQRDARGNKMQFIDPAALRPASMRCMVSMSFFLLSQVKMCAMLGAETEINAHFLQSFLFQRATASKMAALAGIPPLSTYALVMVNAVIGTRAGRSFTFDGPVMTVLTIFLTSWAVRDCIGHEYIGH